MALWAQTARTRGIPDAVAAMTIRGNLAKVAHLASLVNRPHDPLAWGGVVRAMAQDLGVPSLFTGQNAIVFAAGAQAKSVDRALDPTRMVTAMRDPSTFRAFVEGNLPIEGLGNVSRMTALLGYGTVGPVNFVEEAANEVFGSASDADRESGFVLAQALVESRQQGAVGSSRTVVLANALILDVQADKTAPKPPIVPPRPGTAPPVATSPQVELGTGSSGSGGMIAAAALAVLALAAASRG